VGKIAWHRDDDCETLRNFAHASTPSSSRVGKIARRRATMIAVPGNFAHPTALKDRDRRLTPPSSRREEGGVAPTRQKMCEPGAAAGMKNP